MYLGHNMRPYMTYLPSGRSEVLDLIVPGGSLWRREREGARVLFVCNNEKNNANGKKKNAQ